MSFHSLYGPVQDLDAALGGLFSGAPLVIGLAAAFLLGLRHASDPDHLVAVTALVAADDGSPRRAARLGAWWGVGHSGVLLLVGLPLIFFKEAVPSWLEMGAERAVGVIILVLSGRVLLKWVRGDFRADQHKHGETSPDPHLSGRRHRHLWPGRHPEHRHDSVRSPPQAIGIGAIHGLAGTGAIVLLLIAALPDKLEAALALAVFAPMSIVSMAMFTGIFSWVLTRPVVAPVYRSALVPALGIFGVLFGGWYAGLA